MHTPLLRTVSSKQLGAFPRHFSPPPISPLQVIGCGMKPASYLNSKWNWLDTVGSGLSRLSHAALTAL